jgi:pseudaminic acid cytidylyltransferase
MTTVAIITARGGSKRIPFKNIKLFHGKPIVAYSIETAINSGIFNEVMVSTDDPKIADISKKFGAVIPFLRSKETSDDYATTADVLKEVIESYNDNGKKLTYACCIYPTAPFITKERLIEAFELLLSSGADSVIPVTKFSFPIWRSFKMENKKISYNWPEFVPKRSQDLPAAYHDCGQFYFFKCEPFLKTGKLVSDNSVGLEIPESEVQDIDSEEDWKIAEIKFLQKRAIE